MMARFGFAITVLSLLTIPASFALGAESYTPNPVFIALLITALGLGIVALASGSSSIY